MRLVCNFCEGYAIVKIINLDESFTFEKCPKKCCNGWNN